MPASVTVPTAQSRSGDILTRTALTFAAPGPDFTRVPPTASQPTRPAPTLAPQPTPSPLPTPDPHLFVITEQDILRAVAGGLSPQEGLQVEGLSVRLGDDRLRLSAARLRYGVFAVQNLDLVGRLSARDGLVRMDVESVAPGGLVAVLVPTLVNQALARYASAWYVEEVRTLEGRLELRIR